MRRALYRFVVASPAPVGREHAAGGVGVAHHVAKFHLDRLVVDGLLAFEYRRPSGRSGPGAGRPAKLYRPADTGLEVSLPERRYRFAGQLLVDAISTARREKRPIEACVRRVAATAGRSVGAEARVNRRSSATQLKSTVVDVLSGHGYQPRADGRDVVLDNCPFHALAGQDPDLVCGMNLAFVEGVVDGVGATKLCPRLEPDQSRCCVRLKG